MEILLKSKAFDIVVGDIVVSLPGPLFPGSESMPELEMFILPGSSNQFPS